MKELNLLKHKKFHFIGVGGISMSGLALMLKRNGFYVQGSNDVANSEVKMLAKKGVRIFLGHSKDNVLGADVVVYSSSIQDDNPELVFARKKNLIILKRAELLGLVAETYKTVIAVAGSHGKTTTSAMIAEMFENAKLKPTIHIGGKLKSIGTSFKLGNKKYFITENCEYKDNFLFVKPDISVILNIDSDHLDYFKSLENIKESFVKYVKNTKENGLIVACGDDENSRGICCFENCASFGNNKNCDVYAAKISEYKNGYYSFDVMFGNYKIDRIKLNIIGKHNVLNALACILVGLVCEIEFDLIKNSIENFSGVERRSEFVGKVNEADVYHDYAHHPKQIEKMVCVANKLKDKKMGRVITIFEPHTFSRTKFLIEDFAKSFCGSDYVFLAPVYSAREDESEGLDSKSLLKEVKKNVKNVELFSCFQEIALRVKNESRKGDIVLVLGAGTIEKLSKMIIE